MRTAANILAAVGLTVVLLTGLSLLASLTDRSGDDDQPNQTTLSVPYGTRLHDDNLVDYMARLPLKLGIRKVNWREPDLYVDLYLDQSRITRQQIFQDIQEIGLFSLQTMKNVEHLYLRVYDGQRDDDARMVLAVTADRRQLRLADLSGDTAQDAEGFVKERFRVQETVRWSGLFD